MRVAMILGALRRETSHDPAAILAASTMSSSHKASSALPPHAASASRSPASTRSPTPATFLPISPAAKSTRRPLCRSASSPDQTYESVNGKLAASDRLVLLSDGVLEARTPAGELYGFERLPALTLMPAQQIADTAQRFGRKTTSPSSHWPSPQTDRISKQN